MAAAVPLLLEANAAFYRAFSDGDLEAMADLWSRALPVACVHPGWPALHGRTLVMESWQVILRKPPPVTFADAESTVWGDMALVLCRENIEGTTLVAGNLFALEADGWHMIHHQATPLSALPGEGSVPPASVH